MVTSAKSDGNLTRLTRSRQLKTRSVFAGSFIMFASFGSAERVDAFGRNTSSYECTESYTSQTADGDMARQWAHQEGSGYSYYGSNTLGVAICPVENDTSLTKQNITSTVVYAYDGSTAEKVYAKACGKSLAGTSTSCGSAVNNGANSVTGNTNLSISDFSAWTGAFNFDLPYLLVSVPKQSGGSTSRVYSFHVSG